MAKTGRRSRHSRDGDYIAIGHRIRQRRLLAKITLEEMSKLVGVSYQQVQKYERGVDRISAGMLAKMAPLLNTTSDELLGLKGRQ